MSRVLDKRLLDRNQLSGFSCNEVYVLVKPVEPTGYSRVTVLQLFLSRGVNVASLFLNNFRHSRAEVLLHARQFLAISKREDR